MSPTMDPFPFFRAAREKIVIHWIFFLFCFLLSLVTLLTSNIVTRLSIFTTIISYTSCTSHDGVHHNPPLEHFALLGFPH